ncbi:hypothetical protein [Rhizobium leguminosarum]|uniref:hypothetical protein n=1 Tax=Rhizobium leguminosarum TaxID=384 RepID=UPI002E13E903|nr:hypothetical protein U8Q02_40575 [Rhizobium leguminosarum]
MNAEWMRPFVEEGLNGTGRQERVALLSTLSELAVEGAWERIDTALDQSQVDRLADTTLMTLVRGTFRFRSRLRAWDTFRDRVATEFRRRGADAERLMRALS